MAWSDPGDFTSGQILTAAQMDSVREAMFFGQATFTNEAARDAAIPATGITLQEGMRAYLTAPTIPAATGTYTLPTGITTVYNGSVWVCTTPISASAAGNGSTTSSTFTATLSGSPGTNASVTLVTGTTARVSLGALIYNISEGNTYMGVAVSGAGTVAAAAGVTSVYTRTTQGIISGRTFVLTGLTAGTNTFTLQYAAGAHTGYFQDRSLIVEGIA